MRLRSESSTKSTAKHWQCWPGPAATSVPYIFEFPADDALAERMPPFRGRESSSRVWRKSIHPTWMSYLDGRGEIESGIYEMCDMLLLPRCFIIKYRAELKDYDVCNDQSKPIIVMMTTSARTALYQLSRNVTTPTTVHNGRPVFGILPGQTWKDVPPHSGKSY